MRNISQFRHLQRFLSVGRFVPTCSRYFLQKNVLQFSTKNAEDTKQFKAPDFNKENEKKVYEEKLKQDWMSELESENANRRKRMLIVFAIVSVTSVTFAFVNKRWKKIRARIRRNLTLDPIPLPQDLASLNSEAMEFRFFTISGEFLHDEEQLVEPVDISAKLVTASKENPVQEQTENVSKEYFKKGAHVITPFKLDDGRLILVNRGWIPAEQMNPSKRMAGQIKGRTNLTALFPGMGLTSYFNYVQLQQKKMFKELVPSLAEVSSDGALHLCLILDADAASSVPGGPTGGQTDVPVITQTFFPL